MSVQILRDLRGLRIQVIHPPDREGVALVEHPAAHRLQLRDDLAAAGGHQPHRCDVVILVGRPTKAATDILKLVRGIQGRAPTLLAVVSYENPSTLQVVLECGAQAVIDRPIRPFGLLTNLTIARVLWLERVEAEKRIRKLERKLSGNNRISKAKAILMESAGLSEQEAYDSLRQQAMSKRLPMDEMADAIVNAHDLLKSTRKGA